jgi:hypothetical protein
MGADDDRTAGRGGSDDHSDALTPSFKLTTAFLRGHPRYLRTLSLTPEHFRFDPVLWHSSVSALREMLRGLAEQEGLAIAEADIDEAVRNLVEGVMLRSREWDR